MLWRHTTCSSWIITSVRSAWSHLLLLVFMSFVSLPVGCHAFVSPMLACFAERRVLCAPQGLPLVDAVMGCGCVHAIYYSHHRVSPDSSAMASPTLVVDPSDTAAQIQQKSNLRIAWRGSQRVNYLYVCILYVMYTYVSCKKVEELWVEVGLIKSIPCHLFQKCISVY